MGNFNQLKKLVISVYKMKVLDDLQGYLLFYIPDKCNKNLETRKRKMYASWNNQRRLSEKVRVI